MPTLERSIYTARPAELVWDFLADFTTTEQWDPPTRSAERVAGDGGPGTVYRSVSRVMGHEVPITYTVTDRRDPHLLRLVGDAGRVRFLDTIEVQPLGAETRVRYTVQIATRGLARPLTPLLGRAMGKVADDAAAQMKRVLDAL